MQKCVILFAFCFLFLSKYLKAQQTFPAEHPVYLYDSLNRSKYEFSGLAKWKDKILLIPQHRSAADPYHIVAVDTASIDSVLNGTANIAKAARKLSFNKELDTLYNAIKHSMLPNKDFGGIEAGVVVNDEIFFTIETDTLCYIIKGKIDSAGWQIRFKPNDTASLPKPDYRFNNAGFESLTYLPEENKLLAVYENNAITTAPTAFTITTDLTQKQPVRFAKPMLFRLTDVAYCDNHSLIGINHYYEDYSPLACDSMPFTIATEYCYYLGGSEAEAAKEMNANPQQTSFTRVVKLTLENNTLKWNAARTISYSSDNWEGILPYKKGALMVVDGRPPGVSCKLSYFNLE